MNLKKVKELLIKLQKDAEARIDNTQRHIRHLHGPVAKDFEEQATERENDDVVYHLNDIAKSELILIKSALERIENGEYGICTQCSSKIDSARLMAVPYTDLCMACAED